MALGRRRGAVARDINDIKEALRKSEENYHNLIDSLLAGFFIIQDGYIVFANQKCFELMQYTESELYSIPVLEFLAPQGDKTEAEEIYQSMLNNSISSAKSRFEVIKKDGSKVCLESAGTVIEYRNKPAIQIAALNINERIKKEEMLLLQSDLLSNVNDCVIVLDAGFTIVLWNRVTEKIFGLREEEVKGKKICEVLDYNRYVPFINPLYEGLDWQGQIDDLVTSNGELKTLKVSVTNIKDERNNVKNVIAIASDISELISSKHEAQAANQTKNEFLANMSHELRTPLVGIMGFCELLSRDSLSYQQKENLGIIQQCADQLLSLVNNILDLSKIEAKEIAIHNRVFDISKLLQNMVQIFQPEVKKKPVTLGLTIDSGIPARIYSDEVKIRQIISNLIVNAVKFTNTGHIQINARREDYAPGGDIFLLRVSIIDTGIGIKPDKREVIFDSFVQGDGSTTRQYGGTGLGLAICKQLISLMGGHIQVENNESGGATFSFVLPIQEFTGIQESRSPYITNSTEPVNILPAATRVLLVEDIAINQQVITRMLEEMGCNVTIAENGKQCLEILPYYNPDIIIMDMQMPIMNGYEATAMIRQDPKCNNIPIIALTAHVMTADIDRCLAAGCNQYLSKPFTREELYHALMECENKRQ